MCNPRFTEIQYLSPAFESIAGFPREHILTNPRALLECLHEDDRELLLSGLRRITRGESADAEWRIVRPDGSIRWIWGRGFPILDEHDGVVRMVGIWRDITERRRAIEDKVRLASIFTSSPASIIVVSADGTIENWNLGSERLFGYSEAEIAGKSIDILSPPEGVREFAHVVSSLERGGQPVGQRSRQRLRLQVFHAIPR